jgi:hypothetical protein
MADNPIKWPSKAVGDGDDLGPPTADLLNRLRLLPDEGVKTEKDSDTPESLQVIQAGSLATSRLWTKLVGAGTVGTAAAGVAAFWNDQTDSVRIAVVLGAAIVLAAGAVGIAVILNADVRGRAAATVAQYQARSQVSTNFIESAVNFQTDLASTDADADEQELADSTLELLVALSSFPKRLRVTRKDGTSGMVKGVKRDPDEGVMVQVDDGDWVPATLIRSYASQPRRD